MIAIIATVANLSILTLVFGATMCSLAMRNTPLIVDTPSVTVARNLGIGGWLIMLLYMGYKQFVNPHDLDDIPSIGRIGVAILALGTNVKTLAQLYNAKHKQDLSVSHQHRRATDPDPSSPMPFDATTETVK